jgi:2,4-dienoyl-CoA reductase (NADPH2)
VNAAKRGHKVVLLEASEQLGGQFLMAKRVPGKDDFHHTIDYFKRQLVLLKVDVRLNTFAKASDAKDFDHVIIAAGRLSSLSLSLSFFLLIHHKQV